jgi:RES domain-containing protein
MYGGRWNPPGVRAIYTAASRSLAALEILVHYAVLPRDFVITPVRIPNRVKICELPQSALMPGWNEPEPNSLVPFIGARYLSTTAVLCVPSAIIPQESNYVLNPEHHDFRYIEFLPSEPFHFDSRLNTGKR